MSDAIHEAAPQLVNGTFDEMIEQYNRLRGNGLPAFTREPYPYWTLLGYDTVRSAFRDWNTYRSGVPFPTMPNFPKSIPIGLNPPEHTAYRKVLNKFFLPERITRLEPLLRANTREQFEGLAREGRCEFAGEVAAPLPQRALVHLMGMPDEAHVMLLERLQFLGTLKGDPEAIARELPNVWTEAALAHLAELKANPRDPETDIITAVMSMEIDGSPVPEEVPFAVIMQLFGAGGDTTTAAMTSIVHALVTDRALQERVRDDESLIEPLINETLRLEPPLHHIGRTAAEPVDFGGVIIEPGENVALGVAGANRDPGKFDDPDALRLDRGPIPHLTFGFGSHLCIGQTLARLELRLMVEELFAVTEWIEPDGEAVPDDSRSWASGYTSLPIRSRQR